MKRSISIINTGIQLVNVIEAIQYTKCTDNYLILGQFNIFPERIKQIEKMLEDDFMKAHFKKIYTLPKQFSAKSSLRYIGYLLAYIKFFFVVFFSKKFDYCFFGVYTDIIQRPINFLAHFKNNKIQSWLVDEGLRVFKDVEDRKAQVTQIEKQQKRKKIWIRDFYLSITKRWYPPVLHYFSAYTLVVGENDKLIVNSYSYWKSNNIYKYNFKENAALIIGQPLFELKLAKESEIENYINHIVSDWRDYNCYYATHPLETVYKKFLPAYFSVIKTPYPTELLLFGAPVKVIAGFNSSLLLNMAKMGTEAQIVSYTINLKDDLSVVDCARQRIEKSFKDAGIKIIKI